ncbi:XTP/dITP diphosphatase [Oceanobacillus sp. 143]|uniref:dITP/XTP pyrophosphatase n=1 Tax=Oceanobacillus zhaokaii TaxID=2052660 RepID=A0A345PHY3_9BACI|nr:XTP/dITP diphosphatase [Oceanobacillus zhaokaii]AXI09613.1 non-canonical purine NTP pyrophosphatase [Oceanobacillus zhaokaii]QGS68971.1 XTP/dITP diphosphatase [Oceanobacillus sp. 143]
MKQILIATKNRGKIAEFKQFFATVNVEVVSLLDLEEPVPDIEETGQTFEENAALKAEEIAQMFNITVLADDSGLIIDALDGRPGIYSARYAGEPTDDKANIRKVLDELVEVPASERTARFICVLAIATPGEETLFYKGYCEGTIRTTEKGENGFGYDPIFIPQGYNQTMAELSPEEKNKISHRKNAISQLEKGIHSR